MNQNVNDCKCPNCKGVYTVINRPGDSEAIVRCEDCGQLWYDLLFERMNFSGGNDIFEEYQIPITTEEYQMVKDTEYEDLSLQFLAGRKARVKHDGGIVEIDSDFALRRCGRSG